MDAEPKIELTPRQRRMIPLLLASSITDACARGKVSRKLVWQWMKDGHFKSELDRARNDPFNESLEKESRLTSKRPLISSWDGGRKTGGQCRAAERVLEYALKVRQMDELEKRVADLELALTGGMRRL